MLSHYEQPDNPTIKPTDTEWKSLIYKFKDGTTLDLGNDYEVSRCGQVWSNKTNRLLCSRKHMSKANLNRTIKDANHRAYQQVSIYHNRKNYKLNLSRMVACAFVSGYAPSMTINHIDENKDNNHADNLEWMTLKDNIASYFNNKNA